MSLSRYYDYNATSMFDRLFDNLVNDYQPIVRNRNFKSDIKTEEGVTNVTVEMPGVSADDLNVTVKDNLLEVSGKSRSGKQHTYSYFLNPSIHDENNIKATLKDGLLELKVNHIQKSQPKTIKVAVV